MEDYLLKDTVSKASAGRFASCQRDASSLKGPVRHQPVKKDAVCSHDPFEMYLRPCLKCDKFCNCRYTYFCKEYPDVLVRSVDKHIVQLSGNLVRASVTLARMVDNVAKEKNLEMLEEDTVVISREPGMTNCIKGYKTLTDDEKNKVFSNADATTKTPVSTNATPIATNTTPVSTATSSVPDAVLKYFNDLDKYNKLKEDFPNCPIAYPILPPTPPPEFRIRNTARKFQLYKQERQAAEEVACKWEDLIEIDKKKDKVLVLFDQDTDVPTLGIARDILVKVDYYINMHLDDVDMRVVTKKRATLFKETSPYQDCFLAPLLEELERNMNSWQCEDWEEEFFNVGTVIFFELHKANQELLIWDLYFAIEKWLYLGRGYPQLMINGEYDVSSDPEFDETDKKNLFGLPNIPYPNRYRQSWHVKSRYNLSHFNRVGFTPRWWSITRHQETELKYRC